MSKRNRAKKPPGTGKLVNDRNLPGEETPTQKNEGSRSPESRSDRLSQAGSQNQTSSRRGGPSGRK